MENRQNISTFRFASLPTIIRSYCDGVWMWQGAQCSLRSAASLKYHTPDNWHDIPSSHIILTPGWPVLALLSLCRAPSQRAANTIFNAFWLGINPITSHSQSRHSINWATVQVSFPLKKECRIWGYVFWCWNKNLSQTSPEVSLSLKLCLQ